MSLWQLAVLSSFDYTNLYICVMIYRYSDVIMSRWRLKSMAPRLFAQPFVEAQVTEKIKVRCLCEGNPPVTGGFPSQRASKAAKVSIWWRHHDSYNSSRNLFLGTHYVNTLILDDFPSHSAEIIIASQGNVTSALPHLTRCWGPSQ